MTSRPKVVIDSDIPFIRGVLEPYFHVSYLKAELICKESVRESDALIIRTRTKCNASLLEGSSVKCIVSATIGDDHIDSHYCATNSVAVYTAAGCNAGGVVQYVLTTLFLMATNLKRDIMSETIGIVGAGNVGERLSSLLHDLGINVLRCDPPLRKMLESDPLCFKQNSGVKTDITNAFKPNRSSLNAAHYHPLEELIEKCGFISLHVPLTNETYGMIDNPFFKKANPRTVLINTSRGEVIDESSLIENRGKLSALNLDVWRDEPRINTKLLSVTTIATPHIAGYSLEGKINATVLSVRNLAEFFSITPLKEFAIEYPREERTLFETDPSEDCIQNISRLLTGRFRVMIQDRKLRENPLAFDELRNSYTLRREFSESFLKIMKKVIKG